MSTLVITYISYVENTLVHEKKISLYMQQQFMAVVLKW